MFREMGYDGIVLESWSRWAAYGILHDPSLRNLVSLNLVRCFALLSLSLFKHLYNLREIIFVLQA